jgi:ATP phosphoribosyltransferase
MEKGVMELLSAAGIQVRISSRAYRPSISLPDFETKILKPQDIVEMLHIGSRDLGFAGADWVEEMQVELVELLDTGMDPVTLVAAAPKPLLVNGKLPNQKLVVASEYERLTRKWITEKKIDASFVRSHGATEVFPPEDADCIVDNTSTGSTLRANNLEIMDQIMTSSTRLYASPAAMKNPAKKAAIEKFAMLAKSVVDARLRVMLEVNVAAKDLEKVISILPSMRKPTISELHSSAGYVVKAAVPRAELTTIIPAVKNAGGTDVVVSLISQLVA